MKRNKNKNSIKRKDKKNIKSTNGFKKIIKFEILLFIILINNILPSKKYTNINFQKLNPFNLIKKTKLKLNPGEIIYMGERKLIKDVIKSYFSLISDRYKEEKDKEAERLYELSLLKDLPEDPILLNNIKKSLLDAISKGLHKNLSKIDTVFLRQNGNFGNSIICLNNIIFYCEILGCKNITLNKRNIGGRPWHIKNPIILEDHKLTIQVGDYVDCKKETTLCTEFRDIFFFFPLVVRVQLRVNYIKDEILRNIPKIVTDPNDLYIHLRSGDIFQAYNSNRFYAQPPFCFYDKIIKSYKFNKIYIIASDESNIVINELFNKYPTLIYKRNHLDVDIAYLSYAYNIVSSTSSFICSIIKLNDNLKYLWEYDIYRLSQKIYHLHYHFFNFPNTFTIYSMKPSDIYRNELYIWKFSEEQKKLMIEDKCPNNFTTLRSNYDLF